jgi:RNA polymerase sigma-70 factor, ECF subfamily
VLSEPALEDLLAAVATGDRRAFRALYDRTSAKLYGIVRRILPEKGLADDAMQDAYTRIWHNADSFDATRGRPITWLATIARNIAIDIHRRERSQGWPQTLVDFDLHPGEGADVSDEDRLSLAGCLDQLETVHRACLLAAYCGGFSREELAAHFAKPVGTIKSWLHRGLASLKACLDD